MQESGAVITPHVHGGDFAVVISGLLPTQQHSSTMKTEFVGFNPGHGKVVYSVGFCSSSSFLYFIYFIYSTMVLFNTTVGSTPSHGNNIQRYSFLSVFLSLYLFFFLSLLLNILSTTYKTFVAFLCILLTLESKRLIIC